MVEFLRTDMCNILGLEQLIGDYTRVTCHSKTLFDPIYTNVSHKHSYSGIVQTSKSDHYMVYTTVSKTKVFSKGVTMNKRNYKHFSLAHFQYDLRHQSILLELHNIHELNEAYTKGK